MHLQYVLLLVSKADRERAGERKKQRVSQRFECHLTLIRTSDGQPLPVNCKLVVMQMWGFFGAIAH